MLGGEFDTLRFHWVLDRMRKTSDLVDHLSAALTEDLGIADLKVGPEFLIRRSSGLRRSPGARVFSGEMDKLGRTERRRLQPGERPQRARLEDEFITQLCIPNRIELWRLASALQALGRQVREDDARMRLLVSRPPRKVYAVAKQQKPPGRREPRQGMHGMKFGKVDLGNEAERPRALAAVPLRLLLTFPGLRGTRPRRAAAKAVQPMAGAEENAGRH